MTTLEVWVGNLNSLGSRGRVLLLGCGAALAACLVPAGAGAAGVTPRSLTDCGGKVSANPSGAAADEPNLLTYRFTCDTSISAYTIIVQQQGDPGGSIDDYDPAPSVFETDGLTPSPTESITCGGTTPSNGINCNTATQGAQLTNEFAVQGSVDPVQAYCKHLPTDANGKTAKPGTPAVPQALVQLVVTDFTGAEDGPFNLGPAKPCAKVPNAVPTPKAKVKAKPKKKASHSTKKHG